MSQRAVEQALGRMVTDEGFREAFLADPAGTAVGAGLDLSSKELDALTRIPRQALATLCAGMDGRICRLYLPGRRRAETEEGRR